MIHTVKGFRVVNEAEVGVFLEFSCFFYDPTDVGNLISGSLVFFKASLNIWKFTVHVLLKPGLENQMVIAAMKLKDTNSLEWKVMTNLDSIFKTRDIIQSSV